MKRRAEDRVVAEFRRSLSTIVSAREIERAATVRFLRSRGLDEAAAAIAAGDHRKPTLSIVHGGDHDHDD